MKLDSSGTGAKIAGGSGLVLLLVMFFLSWFTLNGFSIDVSGAAGGSLPSGLTEISGDQLQAQADASGEDLSKNALESFKVIDIILLIAAVAALVLLLVGARVGGGRGGALATAVAALGALAFVLVLYRLINTPDLISAFGGVDSLPDGVDVSTDIGRGVGAFIGLLATAGIAFGGWTAMHETAAPAPTPAAPPAGAPPAPPPPQSSASG
jgi:hypothetical protein